MARIIRSQARVVPAEVVDAREEAAQILQKAHERAAAVIAEERARVESEARAAAHLEVEAARCVRLRAIEAEVTQLALEVARRAVADALEADPDRVRALVRQALDRVRRATKVRVRVCAADAERLDGLPVEVVADPSLTRGDCVLESDLGDVDARLDVRFEAIAAALKGSTE